MAFVDTRTLLKNLADVLAAIKDGDQDGGTPLFQVVGFYDAPRLNQALRDLFKYKKKAALVVPANFRHSNDRKEQKILTRRFLELDIIISDKDYSPGQPAYFGMKEVGGQWQLQASPGVIGMVDIVIAALTGHWLNIPGVALEPAGGAPLRVVDQESKAGREAWIQTFITRAGTGPSSITQSLNLKTQQ